MSTALKKSLYRTISKEDLVAEYSAESHKKHDFQKLKWASHESMVNRFYLALKIIDWQMVSSWVDIGCGTGLFFKTIEKCGHSFDLMTGVDITPSTLLFASSRRYRSPARFLNMDLEALAESDGNCDLLTMIGVLQQCGAPAETALKATLRVLRPGGQFFITTKHIGWNAFAEKGLQPDPGHSWFDIDELVNIASALDMEICDAGGFIPKDNKIVPPGQSHTIYLYGLKKNANRRL